MYAITTIYNNRSQRYFQLTFTSHKLLYCTKIFSKIKDIHSCVNLDEKILIIEFFMLLYS